MPFARNADLPAEVRNSIPSQEGQTVFRRVANSQFKAGKSDAVAFASAWKAVKDAGFKKTAGVVRKIDEDQRLVGGWASVIELDGTLVVDSQGDTIDEEELLKAAHNFVVDYREGHIVHSGQKVADVVESLVFTKDVQKALGIDLGMVGWWIMMKVHDDQTWELAKSGELLSFSIGGSGTRTEI